MLQQRHGPRKNDAGFTLVELLIVIVILGVCAAVVFAVGGINAKSKAAACTADVATVQTASDAYNALNGAYAADIAASSPLICCARTLGMLATQSSQERRRRTPP